MPDLKLFMFYLGCRPTGRHVEQHDVFFGIAAEIKDLVPEINAFWQKAGKIHIDAWREVNAVDGYSVKVILRTDHKRASSPGLFFINLGGYQRNVFSEQHYMLLTVKPDKASAINASKKTQFFRENHFDKATSHIDEKYGIDIDDIYEIDEVLPASQKDLYSLQLLETPGLINDEIYLGYFKLSQFV